MTAAAQPAGSGLPPEPVIANLMRVRGIQRVPSPRLTLFVQRGFLPPDLCAAICGLIDSNRRPSTVSDPNGDDAFRTSETCDLSPDDPIVIEVEARIAALTGLDPQYGEPIQGQRYAVGQQFKAHTDFFDVDGVDYERYTSVAGNRTWTVMIYLNEPKAGGATRFKEIDKIVPPETGKLLAWNNRLADGGLNGATLHAGMKVRAGTKYVITKWFRERPWGW
ncbi:2OG-Fe(II) oxygenase [Sphingomonas gilva]|uniref:2OG-Fe(II) oxygenase n=1 Tax=Sphingomonas gilva TaxID=2305907 RepID=A0A396RLC8_9SPHN|nr:2OG-Fe(II) oxygenase [Sphingomonas gilva]RHW17100.1 2OG-Fe(II) oxygenase [Sphingomonas gilva]